MAQIVVDTSQWPVALVTWDGDQTDADLAHYFAETRRYLARREPYVVITWMKKFQNRKEHREQIAQFMRDTDEAARKYLVCAAMISTSLAFRFVLSTVFLMKSMASPYKVCASFDEAATFCREQAALKHLVLPPVLRPFAAIAPG